MKVADGFAGVGGFSAGAEMAGCEVVWGGNHWPLACELFKLNHPGAVVLCQDLTQADFTALPWHDLLLMAPACQGHTNARGRERPHHDGLRATAWAVVSAVESRRVPCFVVENVKEFSRWACYPAWCAALQALGYALRPILVDAADHGVAQHRVRLLIVGTRSKKPIDLQLPRRPHVPAREVIQFDAGTWSPIASKRESTLRRVRNGRARFGERFLFPYYGNGSGLTGRCLSRPIGTLTTRARWGVVDGDRMRMVSVAEQRAFMGLPAGYHLPATTADAIMMMGNAVVPQVAADVILAIKAAA